MGTRGGPVRMTLEERQRRREEMLAMLAEGRGVAEIASIYKLTRARAYAILARPPKAAGRPWPKQEERARDESGGKLLTPSAQEEPK